MELQKRLTSNHIRVCAVSILLIGAFLLVLLYQTVLGVMVDSMENSLAMFSDQLNAVIEEAEQLCIAVANDSSVQSVLRNGNANASPDYYLTKLNVNNRLMSLRNATTQPISGLSVLMDSGLAFKGQDFQLNRIDFRQTEWYQTIKAAESYYWYGSTERSLMVHNLQGPYIAMGMPLTNYRNGFTQGIVLIDVDQNAMLRMIDYDFSKSVLSTTISSSNSELVINNNLADPHNAFGTLSVDHSLTNGWVISMRCSVYHLIWDKLADALLLLVLIVILVFMLTLYISIRLSRSITTPIQKLTEQMEPVKSGDFSPIPKIITSDILEVQNLITGFELMKKEVNRLFLKLEAEQEEIRKAQFATLQAQINPHFIFNTIDNISWHIRKGEDKIALDSLRAMSRLFRIALSKGNPFIRLEEEIEHVRLYLQLMSTRYEGNISYEFMIEDEQYLNYYTFKLLLQPLTENAIYHGIAPKPNARGIIRISVNKKGSDLVLAVYDNGLGIAPDKLLQIQNNLKNYDVLPEGSAEGGYGIYNINRRIKYHFGEQYGIKIDSKQNEYTLVKITILPCGKDGRVWDDQDRNC